MITTPTGEQAKALKHVFYIVDECDSIMLERSKEFVAVYEGISKHIGGMYFLTATSAEKISGEAKSLEENFISTLPDLTIVKYNGATVARQKAERNVLPNYLKAGNIFKDWIMLKSRKGPVLIYAKDESRELLTYAK